MLARVRKESFQGDQLMTIDLRHDLHDPEIEKLVRRIAEIGMIKFAEQPFKLKAGGFSRVYVFGRDDLTENPDVLFAIGQLIANCANEFLDRHGIKGLPCFIGIPTAGSPLATAATRFGGVSRIMREKPKTTYGASECKWMNSRSNPLHAYFAVDNVVTDGGSKIEANDRLQEDNYPVYEMVHIVVVDRQQGAVEALRAEGMRVEVIFNLLDLVWAFGELGLWSRADVAAVEAEITALQLK